jgi:hypothetical protein
MMKKYFIIALCSVFLITASVVSAEITHSEEEVAEMLTLMEIILPADMQEQEWTLLMTLFTEIDHNKVHNAVKKNLLKKQTILFNLMAHPQSQANLDLIAKRNFPVAVCLSFQFRQNTTKTMTDLLHLVLNNDTKIIQYNQNTQYLYSDEMKAKMDLFFPKNGADLKENCR